MVKEKEKYQHQSSSEQSNPYADWYALWNEQSKVFFASAEKNLHDLFQQTGSMNPNDSMHQFNQWLNTLKTQWQYSPFADQQKMYANYWQLMVSMFNEAAEKMSAEWMKRSNENHPIKNAHELYEVWLNCCHEIYQKSLHSRAYQEAYIEFMNAAFKFWKANIPK